LLRTHAWLAVPLAFVGLVCLAVYPGRWTADTAAQRAEIASGSYTDWYGPVFNAVLHVGYLVVPSLGALLIIQLTLLTLAVYSLAVGLFTPRVAAIVTLVVLGQPAVLGWGIALSRDVWYGVALLCAAASTSVLLRNTTLHPVARGSLIAAGLAAMTLAVAAKQNGFIGLIPLVSYALWSNPRARWLPLRERRFAGAVAATVAGLVICLAALSLTRAIAYGPLDARRTYPQQPLYVFDTAGLSVRAGRSLFDTRVFDPARFPSLASAWWPTSVSPLVWTDAPLLRIGTSQESPLRDKWLSAIADQPFGYLRMRWGIFSHLIGARRAPASYPYHRLEWSTSDGAPARHPAASRIVEEYLGWFESSVLHRGILYALAIVAFIPLGWRRNSAGRIIAVAGLGSLLYVSTYFFLAVVIDTRFNWVMVVLGTLCAAGCVQALASFLRCRLQTAQRSGVGRRESGDGRRARDATVRRVTSRRFDIDLDAGVQ
jgi:hypothetical protein